MTSKYAALPARYIKYSDDSCERTFLTKKFDCDACEKTFVTERSRTRHIKLTHDLSISCPIYYCHYTFPSIRYMQLHFQKLHSVADATEGTFSCSHCRLKFEDLKQMNRHMLNVHHGLKQKWTVSGFCTCACCDSGIFTAKSDFKKHNSHKVAIVTTYRCSITAACAKETHRVGEMKKHVATHDLAVLAPIRLSGASKKCPDCVYTSKYPDNLRRHMDKGSCANRDYPCHACGKFFTNKNSRRRHTKGPCPRRQLTEGVKLVKYALQFPIEKEVIALPEEVQMDEVGKDRLDLSGDEMATEVSMGEAAKEVSQGVSKDEVAKEVSQDVSKEVYKEVSDPNDVDDPLPSNHPQMLLSLLDQGGPDRLFMKKTAANALKAKYKIALCPPLAEVNANGECNTTAIAVSIGVENYVEEGINMRAQTVVFWKNLLSRNLLSDDAFDWQGVPSLQCLLEQLAICKQWDFPGADLATYFHSASTGRSILLVDLDSRQVIPIYPDSLLGCVGIGGMKYDPLKTAVIVKYKSHFEALLNNASVGPVLEHLKANPP